MTGGIGFVGTNLLPQLLKDNEYSKVTVLDNLRYTANPEVIPDFSKNKKFEFVEGDIRDKDLVQRLVGRNDLIINLAAETFVDKSIASSRIFFEVNVLGTLSLLEASLNSSVIKFIQVSTDEVWGEAKQGMLFRETTPYAPRNPYAASKASADHVVRAFGETYGLPYNIVHFTNLYGPWQYPEKLIPLSIIRLLEGKKIQLYGDGRNIRTWLHVEDSISGLLRVIREGKKGESYALGSRDEKTNLELAKLLLSIFGKPETEIEFVEDRPGHDLRYAVDFSKIKRDLRWKPRVGFENGLKDKVEWFRQHSDWWGRRN